MAAALLHCVLGPPRRRRVASCAAPVEVTVAEALELHEAGTIKDETKVWASFGWAAPAPRNATGGRGVDTNHNH